MRDNPIVYFCAEYALDDAIPTYAGGLGILAGDIIREAAEQNVPFITVGLYYHEGYIYHDLDKDAIVMKNSSRTNPISSKLKPVLDEQKKRIIITVPIKDTLVYVQAWVLQIGSVRTYLLDTNISQNKEENRKITDQLYPSVVDVRLKQEMVLGLGGLRLLDALGITPVGYHLNEGHSAFLALEIAKYSMKKQKQSFLKALKKSKQSIFFTNHTLLPAGNNTFKTEIVREFLPGFAKEVQVPVDEIIELGVIPGKDVFSMTHLALRMSGKINAVSKLHALKAKEIWKEYSMIPITNGVHGKTWDKMRTNEHMWEKHQVNKRELLQYIHSETGELWDKDTLLLGWARRIVGYKRPFALFDKLKQFKKLASTTDRQIRVVISGLSHESNVEGLDILKQLQKIVTEELKGIVVYLPNYNMESAKLLVSGSDAWLNTPIVGLEACGTSGMKAAINGVLPFSTNDGWVAEADLHNVGWLLEDENLSEDILSVLKEKIIPLYYARDDKGIPRQWVKMMQNARDMGINQFSTTTMFRKYIEEFYLPLISKEQAKPRS